MVNIHHEKYIISPGQPDVLYYGDDISIFAMGSMAHEPVAARNLLEKTQQVLPGLQRK